MTFEIVWSNYPRKIAKSIAFKAYNKALKKGTSDDDIIAGIIRFAEHVERTGTASQFIPHLATFINQERWIDTYDTETTGSGNNGGESQISLGMASAVKIVEKARQDGFQPHDPYLDISF